MAMNIDDTTADIDINDDIDSESFVMLDNVDNEVVNCNVIHNPISNLDYDLSNPKPGKFQPREEFDIYLNLNLNPNPNFDLQPEQLVDTSSETKMNDNPTNNIEVKIDGKLNMLNDNNNNPSDNNINLNDCPNQDYIDKLEALREPRFDGTTVTNLKLDTQQQVENFVESIESDITPKVEDVADDTCYKQCGKCKNCRKYTKCALPSCIIL